MTTSGCLQVYVGGKITTPFYECVDCRHVMILQRTSVCCSVKCRTMFIKSMAIWCIANCLDDRKQNVIIGTTFSRSSCVISFFLSRLLAFKFAPIYHSQIIFLAEEARDDWSSRYDLPLNIRRWKWLCHAAANDNRHKPSLNIIFVQEIIIRLSSPLCNIPYFLWTDIHISKSY